MYTNLYQKHTAYQYQRGFRARLQSRWQRPVTATLYLYATDDKNFYNQTHCLPIASCRRKRFFSRIISTENGGPDLPVISKHPFLAGTPERRRQIFFRTDVFLIGTTTFTKTFNLHQNLSPFLGNECGIGSLQKQSPPPTPSNNP